MKMKMNMHPKETLAGGINLGDVGSDLIGPHNPAKLVNTDMLRSEFVFDVLNGCDFNCAGCFISRRNTCTSQDISNAIEISDTLHGMGISCEEMFIGPTDIFTATNFDEIMNDPLMYDLTARFSLTTSSTLMSDTMKMKQRWHVIQKHLNNAPARDFELFVAFDLNKYLQRDEEYLAQLTTNLKLFEKDTVVFIVNYHEGMLNHVRLLEVAEEIHNEFNVPLRIIPSFFRVNNQESVERKSRSFIEMLIMHLDGVELPEYLSFNMFDKYFGGEGFINISYKDGQLYLSPFLYEAIPQTHDMFKIDQPYNSENISSKLSNLIRQQFQYASQTYHCASCELLSSCVGKKVLTYMESRNLVECIVPKTFIWDERDYI